MGRGWLRRIYSATKSAIHAFTVSLRQQIHGGSVHVIELIPPSVSTNLQREHESSPKQAMDLDTFIKRAMRSLDSDQDELPIGLSWLSTRIDTYGLEQSAESYVYESLVNPAAYLPSSCPTGQCVNVMPSYADRLSDDQLNMIVAFLLSFPGESD